MVINVKYWKNDSRKNQIIKAVKMINGLQNYYYLTSESLDKVIKVHFGTPREQWFESYDFI